MKSLLFWVLIAGAAYFLFRATIADNRLWWERRPDAPLWKVWFSPWRYFTENLYTESGELARRNALRSMGWALVLLLCAAVVGAL